jgi:macrolide-specific efflux system membrane fusion protein
MKKKWWIIIIVIAVAAISLFLFLQSKPSSDQGQMDGSSAFGELSFPVERKDISNMVEVKGKSSYAEETWIYAPFSSTVKQWHVEEGQSVTKDTLLFELDNEKLRNEISLTEAQLLKQQLISKISAASSKQNTLDTAANETQQAFSRFAKKEEARLQQQLDDIQLRITEMELNDKKNQLKQSAYMSSKSGIFLYAEQQKPKSVNEDVALGKIVELTSLQLLCTVTEYDIFRIKEGMEVDIRIDARRQMKVKGIVEHVSKFAKTGTDQGTSAAQFEVQISLDQSSELIAGLSLTGKIITESKKAALVVPTLAVMHEDEQYFVYVATPTGVDKRDISIGLETAEKTEILEGLSEGDTVVLQ